MKTKNPIIEKSPNIAEVELTYKTKIKAKDRVRVTGSPESVDILRSVWSDKIEWIEEFVILLLNRNNQVLGWVKISQGGTSGTFTDPKIIFQYAINANASGVILSHNHPSGNLKPSQADRDITERIKNGGKLLDISILDHIIMTEDGYFSFADEGLL